MPRSSKSVTEKNTKQEILEAYQELLAEASKGGSQESFAASEERTTLKSASNETVEKITADLSKLKLSFNQTLVQLTEQLTAEAERLAVIQKAITIAQKDLEETQRIKVTAGLLYRMIEVQKQKEHEFEEEMKEKRKTWEEEQHNYEETIKRDRTRNAEEYAYEQKLQKKRDSDEREAEKQVKLAVTRELEELRKKAGGVPQEIEQAVKEAVVKALADAKRDTDTKALLTKQQTDSELRLAQTTIASLEKTAASQMTEITQLKRQLDEATKQVKDIAVSVIENTRKDLKTESSSQNS